MKFRFLHHGVQVLPQMFAYLNYSEVSTATGNSKVCLPRETVEMEREVAWVVLLTANPQCNTEKGR